MTFGHPLPCTDTHTSLKRGAPSFTVEGGLSVGQFPYFLLLFTRTTDVKREKIRSWMQGAKGRRKSCAVVKMGRPKREEERSGQPSWAQQWGIQHPYLELARRSTGEGGKIPWLNGMRHIYRRERMG